MSGAATAAAPAVLAERATVFACEGDDLVGILHEASQVAHADGGADGTLGVIIIVAGGPQYRAGAHRQFVLLGRRLAAAGLPTLRFDHRGTGDSGGEYRGFIDMDADIAAAIDELQRQCPDVNRVALWGECESASAAAYYAYRDARVSGVFMVNPWVRTEAGLAKTYLKHHYTGRLKDPEFWRKVRSGQFDVKASVASLAQMVGQVARDRVAGLRTREAAEQQATGADYASLPLPERLEASLEHFQRDVYILTSGRDHIAKEFSDFFAQSAKWRARSALGNVTEYVLEDADHTFSRTAWRTELFDRTVDWTRRLGSR